MKSATPVKSASLIRWRIPIVLGVTVFVNYLDRNNLALALPRIARDFGWNDREVGAYGEWLLGAFFLSYALSNMLLGPLAERFGPKRSIIAAIAAFSLFTILSAPLGQSLTALIVLRLLLGLGEGVHIPMSSAITSRWFPPHERSRANTIWGAGIILAVASAPLIVIPLVRAAGWRPTFAILGTVGMLLSLPLVWFFVDDAPQIDRSNPKLVDNAETADYKRDWKFWLVTLGGTLNAFCAFGILNWLPTYFDRAKGIDFERLGYPLAMIFTAGIVGMALMAYLGDKFQRRALIASIGFAIAGVFVYIASSANELAILVLCFAIAVFFQSAYGAQEYAIVQRLLPPNRVGAGTGLYNGLSILFGGVGGSLVPGSIVAATGSFDAAISSIVAGAILAAFVMLVLARSLRY
ncbi:MAG: MFS transporter [Cyanosarcina radialis HA8281-LM2]|jgi:MFS family permease|nr:MFS transporter [Cyanosarcina radialis HA8281-LM2]